jgi:hypothetical protein
VNTCGGGEGTNKGKMKIIKDGVVVKHTIINIPCSEIYFGVIFFFFFLIFFFFLFIFVYFKFSTFNSSFILNILSLKKVLIEPLELSSVRFVGYDFDGGFEDESYDHLDENGKEIVNINDYYQE